MNPQWVAEALALTLTGAVAGLQTGGGIPILTRSLRASLLIPVLAIAACAATAFLAYNNANSREAILCLVAVVLVVVACLPGRSRSVRGLLAWGAALAVLVATQWPA